MKRIYIVILSIFMTLALVSCAVYTEEDLDDARQSGYDEGYDVGYEEGYNEGRTDGYDDGFSAADNYTESSYSDEIPNTAVFVTPHGEKYHESWCQYVSNRTDISYYNTADEAELAGYSPCSVCH